jgi:hypothetical protein
MTTTASSEQPVMRTPKEVGNRIKIARMEHSPGTTRRYAGHLLGRQGVAVGVVLSGSVALVKLDGDPYDFPQGCRRWAVLARPRRA